MKPFVAVFLVLACSAVARAAEPIIIGERITIASKVLGEQRTVLISTPEGYARGEERYPVLYMTDGSMHLTHTRGTVDFLLHNGLIPDVIIVAVVSTDRTRDLTPTRAMRVQADGKPVEIAGSGGAGKFLDFFARELIPYVEQHYRTRPYRIFAGHSLGGLFALTALASRPELFHAFIAASPSLEYDEEYALRHLQSFFKERRELPRTLLVTMANEEAGQQGPTRFERLQQILGAATATGFEWDAKLMADETHRSVVLPSHYWALPRIFASWALPLAPCGRVTGGVEEMKSHYAGVSRRFGFTIIPGENAVNAAGYAALQDHATEEAIALFAYNMENHPLSANVYDSLGEALERAGRLAEAHACYSRAVEIATRKADANLAVFTAHRDLAAERVKETKAR